MSIQTPSIHASMREEFLRRRWIPLLAAGWLSGFLACTLSARILAGAGASILSSFVVTLACFAVLLARLPAMPVAWGILRAWLGSTVLCAAGCFGIYCGVGNKEAFWSLLLIAAVFSAQAGALSAIFGMLSLLLFPRGTIVKQMTLGILALAATALFWSREPILQAGSTGTGREDRYAEAVMELSPPATVAAAWYGERRFDLQHAPATYNQWVGAYQSVAYPPMLPHSRNGVFNPGVLLALLSWALPLIFLCDYLMSRKIRS